MPALWGLSLGSSATRIGSEGGSMTKLATVKSESRLARPLNVLVPLIQEELSAGDSAGLEHYRRAGELLLEARNSGQVAAFKWGAWLSKNFEMSRRTAYRYMHLAEAAENDPDIVTRRGTTIRGAINEPKWDTRAPSGRTAWRPVASAVREVDRDRLAQERQTIETEVKLHRELAEELVDIGYRALATRLHPDKGGSKDAMRRLNRVRDDLKSLASTRRFV
jgi:hypothetical protein